jgi:tRNA threonylcarbamoyladenosine biosynthesis protein TsaE
MAHSLCIRSGSPEETQAVGQAIGAQAQPGDAYLLTGTLGAGKTCLTQGIARGLEVPGYVRSPTFVLTHRHQGRLLLYHLDLYRIGGPSEAWDLGLDEQLFGDGVCVVEWADRAEELFPPSCCWVSLEYGPSDECRNLTLSAETPRYAALLQSLAGAFPGTGEVNP